MWGHGSRRSPPRLQLSVRVQAMLAAADSDSDGKMTFEDLQRLVKVIDGASA